MQIDYPGARIGKTCIRCGGCIRVVTAKRLLAGKTNAHIIVACECFSGTYRPTKEERLALLHRQLIPVGQEAMAAIRRRYLARHLFTARPPR